MAHKMSRWNDPGPTIAICLVPKFPPLKDISSKLEAFQQESGVPAPLLPGTTNASRA